MMRNTSLYRSMRASLALLPAAALLLGACSEPTSPATEPEVPGVDAPSGVLQAVDCTASVRTASVTCRAAGSGIGGASATIIGGQGTYVRLTSSNLTYTALDSLFAFDVTVTNLLNEAIGTVDGITLDSLGVRVFFHEGPTVTAGTGTITVFNADGTRDFLTSGRPYFQYNQVLAKNAVSSVKRWQLKVPSTVESFTFTLFVSTETQRLVVINEMMPNPAGTVQDSVGEYVELYNAGTLRTNLNGFIVADNTAGVADTIKTDLYVAPGGYVLLGRSADTSKNGGITPDYLYTSKIGTTSTSLTFSNSGSEFFRVRAPTGVTVDSAGYASGSTTAVSGVARELKNPALDNTAVDGTNWGAATTVYDPTTANNNRGTPKAQNSVFTP